MPSFEALKGEVLLDNRMVTLLAYVIIGAWAISFLADLIVRTYDPPPTVHALMMALAGSAFVRSAYKKDSNGKE